MPELVIAHLSDTHLTSTDLRYNGVIDPQAALERVADVSAACRRRTAARWTWWWSPAT